MTAAGPPPWQADPRAPARAVAEAGRGDVARTRSRKRWRSCGMITTKRAARLAMSAPPPLPGSRTVGWRQSPM